MDAELAKILAPYAGQKGALIPVLQKVQGRYGYLPQELLTDVAKFCRVSVNEVFGVASFYAQFHFVRPGEHTVKVCLGTACHVRGGENIMKMVCQEIGVRPGETTPDYKFTLERVGCLGCCALAPVVVVDDKVYSKMNPAKVIDVLTQYRSRGA